MSHKDKKLFVRNNLTPALQKLAEDYRERLEKELELKKKDAEISKKDAEISKKDAKISKKKQQKQVATKRKSPPKQMMYPKQPTPRPRDKKIAALKRALQRRKVQMQKMQKMQNRKHVREEPRYSPKEMPTPETEGKNVKDDKFPRSETIRINFVIYKIHDLLRKRYLDNQRGPMTFNNILKEIKKDHLLTKTKDYLADILMKDPKLTAVPGIGYIYRPPYKVKSPKGLMRLLKEHYENFQPPMLLDDIKVSLPSWQTFLDKYKDQIDIFSNDKKQEVVVYKNTKYQKNVDPEIKETFFAAPLDEETKREINERTRELELLEMKIPANEPRKRKKPQPKSHIVCNEHMKDVLIHYDIPE